MAIFQGHRTIRSYSISRIINIISFSHLLSNLTVRLEIMHLSASLMQIEVMEDSIWDSCLKYQRLQKLVSNHFESWIRQYLLVLLLIWEKFFTRENTFIYDKSRDRINTKMEKVKGKLRINWAEK